MTKKLSQLEWQKISTSFLINLWFKNTEEIKAITNHLIISELLWVSSHGLSRLLHIKDIYDTLNTDWSDDLEINRQWNCYYIDWKSRLWFYVIEKSIAKIMPEAKTNGISMINISNIHITWRLWHYIKQITEVGLWGIILWNTPPSVVALWTTEKATWTNPIAIWIPGIQDIIFDMWTSEITNWAINNAKINGDKLPPWAVVNQFWEYTTNALEAFWSVPFWWHKWAWLNFIIELIVTAMTWTQPHLNPNDWQGMVIILFSPQEKNLILEQYIKYYKNIKTTTWDSLHIPWSRTLWDNILLDEKMYNKVIQIINTLSLKIA